MRFYTNSTTCYVIVLTSPKIKRFFAYVGKRNIVTAWAVSGAKHYGEIADAERDCDRIRERYRGKRAPFLINIHSLTLNEIPL